MSQGALLDTCYICAEFIWRSHSLCHSCLKEIYRSQLLFRRQGELKVLSLLNMQGSARKLVYLCKNGNHRKLLNTLMEILLEKALLEDFPWASICGVVPIPPSSPGVLDHSYWLGERVSRKWNLPFYPQGLKRRVFSKGPQKLKEWQERAAIEFESGLGQGPRQKGVWLLVDDVITTGMTLLQANKAMGASESLCLTLASRPYILLNVHHLNK